LQKIIIFDLSCATGTSAIRKAGIHLRWVDDGYGKCSFSKEQYY